MTCWSAQKERGSPWLLVTMLWIVRSVGWQAGRLLLPAITLFFYVRSGPHCAASRDYLSRVLGRPARRREVFRHIFTFASTIMERVFLLSGSTRAFAFDIQGLHHVEALADEGTGCLLLGAHFGSFEALRHLRTQCPVPVKAVMYRNHIGPLTRVLETIDPALRECIIDIGQNGSMLRVHEAVAEGAFVGMLADRSPEGARAVAAPFFGQPAQFATGPLIVAASLGCPVITFYGVRLGPRHYRIVFEPFAERIILARANRQADLAHHVTRYALWLETGCRAHPFNWFNFYPFWETPRHAAPVDSHMAGPRAGMAAAVTSCVPAD